MSASSLAGDAGRGDATHTESKVLALTIGFDERRQDAESQMYVRLHVMMLNDVQRSSLGLATACVGGGGISDGSERVIWKTTHQDEGGGAA